MMQLHPTQLEREDRIRGVRAWADGIPSTEAAVELLIRHGRWLDEDGFLRSARYCPEVADGEYVTVASLVEVQSSAPAADAVTPLGSEHPGRAAESAQFSR